MSNLPSPNVIQSILTKAMDDMEQYGYDSTSRLERWVNQLRGGILQSLPPLASVENALRLRFNGIYQTNVIRGAVLKRHPGVTRFTLDRLSPQLHHELDRCVLASADLIKLNREEIVSKTVRRFLGWASSIPEGGTRAPGRGEARQGITKAFTSLPYVERRVLVDQGHKFEASLSRVLADASGAIAAIWHSRWRVSGYHYRPDHKERDGKVYLLRGSWAAGAGLVKPGDAGYLDAITQPSEEVNCMCRCEYVTSLSSLPEDMLTEKGKAELMKAQGRLKEIGLSSKGRK